MRNYSFFSIVLLCLAILVVDILAFYWLQSITQLIHSGTIERAINFAFWFFTIGLITSILVLKLRLDNISRQRKQLLISSLYGLTVSSFIPKLVFIIVVSVLYFSNYVFAERASLLVVPLIGLASGFIPFFVILYGIFRTLYRFKIRHISIGFEHLPENFNNLRIVHISDTHLGSFNARFHIFDRAVRMINELEPDLIFFTGDLVNNFSSELDGWRDTFKQLSARMGKYSVLGNHDYGDYSRWETPAEKKENFEEIKDFHRQINFRLLLNESASVEIKNEQIAIVGVENWGDPPLKQYADLQKAYTPVKDIPFKILLSHHPGHWQEEVLNDTDIALTLSGHTHGMQAGISIRGKRWSPIKYKHRHWLGLYRVGDQCLYVNPGLGWLGFPGRLGMRPEITFIELVKN